MTRRTVPYSPLSNPLSKRDDQFLQGQWGERASPQIQDNNLRAIRSVELSSYTIADVCRNIPVFEQERVGLTFVGRFRDQFRQKDAPCLRSLTHSGGIV